MAGELVCNTRDEPISIMDSLRFTSSPTSFPRTLWPRQVRWNLSPGVQFQTGKRDCVVCGGFGQVLFCQFLNGSSVEGGRLGEKGNTMTCFAHPPSFYAIAQLCYSSLSCVATRCKEHEWLIASCSKIRCSVLVRKIISALHIVLCSFSGKQRSKIRWLAWLGNSPHLLLLRRS